MVSAYDLVTHGGKTVDRLTHEALLEVERRLGYPLALTQGSYNAGGVSASAGTHDGGGVVDLGPSDWVNRVTQLRAVGFAAWHRTALTGVWPEHIHAVLIGNLKLSTAAKAQVDDYYKGLNGLSNHAPDPFPRPNPIPVFTWSPERLTRGAHVDAALAHLRLTNAPAGSRRAALLDDAIAALVKIDSKTTTATYADPMSHTPLASGSRGGEVDAALAHIRRALLTALGNRRLWLTIARDKLRAIAVVA